MCYYFIQGRIIKNKHILHIGAEHPNFSRSDLFVGVSRVAHDQVAHVTAPPKFQIAVRKQGTNVSMGNNKESIKTLGLGLSSDL